jgi:deazaflavin-dependent oxidoreductase (nitroreductase family)
MTFEKTPRGTYGQNMPSFAVPLMKLVNPLMLRQARRSKAKPGGLSLVVLTTIGAKSGQRRQTVLGALPEGDNAWIIVASAGGSTANPAWYHNLAAHPDQAEIEVGGGKHAVTAAQLAGDERDAAWQQVLAAGPRYAGYEKKTDRHIPIIRLTGA